MPRRLLDLATMLRAERLSANVLQRTQQERLGRLLEHAYAHVPGYKDLWRRHGIAPRDVRDLRDLRHLPVVDKAYMREAGVERFVDQRFPGGRGLIARHTSGSSGTPFEFYVSPAHNKWRKAQRLRPYVSNGVLPWHRVLAVASTEQPRDLLTEKLGLFAERRISAARPAEALLAEVVRIRPHVLTGYPSALGPLADAYLATGQNYTRPTLVFTDSEMLTPGVRARLTQAFGTEPIDVYGSFETDNIAFQCALRRGLHVAMESCIIEIVDAGNAVEAGREGEIVVTVLGNTAMPFIRYNLHDVAAYEEASCPCGRTLPTLARIDGRRDDYIRLPGGARRPSMPFLFEFDALAQWLSEYRIVQRSVEEFDVELRPTGDLAAAEIRVRAIFARHLPDAKLTFVERRGGIPREASGKRRCFVSAVTE